jgi:hypothetical protein
MPGPALSPATAAEVYRVGETGAAQLDVTNQAAPSSMLNGQHIPGIRAASSKLEPSSKLDQPSPPSGQLVNQIHHARCVCRGSKPPGFPAQCGSQALCRGLNPSSKGSMPPGCASSKLRPSSELWLEPQGPCECVLPFRALVDRLRASRLPRRSCVALSGSLTDRIARSGAWPRP